MRCATSLAVPLAWAAVSLSAASPWMGAQATAWAAPGQAGDATGDAARAATRDPPGQPKTPAARLGEAFRALTAQDPARAYELAARLDRRRLKNPDYALYVLAQSAWLKGEPRVALGHFRALQRQRGSRFRAVAAWRVADCLWELGQLRAAQAVYRRLVAGDDSSRVGDAGLARYRIAIAHARRGARQSAIRALEAFVLAHPAHPMTGEAQRELRALGGERAALSPKAKLERAEVLTRAHLWHEAIVELAAIGEDIPDDVRRERDYQTAMTLFKMRRRYEDAGEILIRIHDQMGGRAARALFHGARALSRADRDNDAIRWYQQVVAKYPRSAWAAEAQFLSGWLEFNMGNYAAAIPHLERTIQRYGRAKWAVSAVWFLGLSHYFEGDFAAALPRFEAIARRGGKLTGGKGAYWHARTLQRLGQSDDATAGYRALVGRYPFSWYALLARSRLTELGVSIGPFGDRPRRPEDAPPLAVGDLDPALERTPLIRSVDELIAAGLGVEAGYELKRGERAFIVDAGGSRQAKRAGRGAALAVVLDRYRRAGNYNRPWMIGVVYGGARALDAPPKGRARAWWEHAYPRAYRELVEKWRHVGDNPEHYLYAIMRKESGFDPHTLSYADAIGLLQMIPPTTRRVVRHVDMQYSDDLLYDPESNIKAGSWYIGRLLRKFKGQIPLGSGSFNCGPRPVMRWLDANGRRPIDEFVELVPYSQTREYMKKVTETYARYVYLYEDVIYEQPLTVDADYENNDLTY